MIFFSEKVEHLDELCDLPQLDDIGNETATVSSLVPTVSNFEESPLLQGPPMGRNLTFRTELRNYQVELARPGTEGKNYIVHAPTGSGKTAVAAFIIYNHLVCRENGKVVFLVNKVPLAEQQMREIMRHSPEIRAASLTGDEGSSQFKQYMERNDLVVCTVGVLLNCLKGLTSHTKVRFKDLSLLVVDECHNTKKNSPYAAVMSKYLKKKLSKKPHMLPQIVGLTATLGAGESSKTRPSIFTAVEHMTKLCAHLDAFGGVKPVEELENKKELQRHSQKSDMNILTTQRRQEDTLFKRIISNAMSNIEKSLKLECPHDKTDQGYENWVTTHINNFRIKGGETRNQIAALENLRYYSIALSIYEDMTEKHAMQMLEEELWPKVDKKGTKMEEALKTYFLRVKEVFEKTPITESPLLIRLGALLKETYTKDQFCQGIIFCKTKHHVQCLVDWIKSSDDLPMLIRPGVVTGHTRDGTKGMNIAEQRKVIEDFRKQSLNLVIATSVLEEGFDVPACNLVIRLHVTNEIARQQAQGRARADDSNCYIMLPKRTEYKVILNEERENIAEQALAHLPKGEFLKEKILEYQKEILQESQAQMLKSRRRKAECSASDFQLYCGKCNAFACKASDVNVHKATYIVTSVAFREKFIAKTHHTPKEYQDFSKTHKIFCKSCESSWGVMYIWKATGREDPVIKCEYFTFEYTGKDDVKERQTFRKWKDVPFDVEAYDKSMQITESDDSSSSEEAN